MLTDSCTPPAVCLVASGSLATFGQDATALGNILVQFAMEGVMISADAVLQALLAFSSLHRYGLQSQAVELKIAALGSLAERSFASSSGAEDAIQHIVAGMLLCSFEIHHSSCTSVQWTRYLSGVQTVIKSFSIHALLQYSSDVAILLDWVHYYSVLARFSLLHWNDEGALELSALPLDMFCSQVRT